MHIYEDHVNEKMTVNRNFVWILICARIFVEVLIMSNPYRPNLHEIFMVSVPRQMIIFCSSISLSRMLFVTFISHQKRVQIYMKKKLFQTDRNVAHSIFSLKIAVILFLVIFHHLSSDVFHLFFISASCYIFLYLKINTQQATSSNEMWIWVSERE